MQRDKVALYFSQKHLLNTWNTNRLTSTLENVIGCMNTSRNMYIIAGENM